MRNATNSLQDILDAIAAVERFTANVLKLLFLLPNL